MESNSDKFQPSSLIERKRKKNIEIYARFEEEKSFLALTPLSLTLCDMSHTFWTSKHDWWATRVVDCEVSTSFSICIHQYSLSHDKKKKDEENYSIHSKRPPHWEGASNNPHEIILIEFFFFSLSLSIIFTIHLTSKRYFS